MPITTARYGSTVAQPAVTPTRPAHERSMKQWAGGVRARGRHSKLSAKGRDFVRNLEWNMHRWRGISRASKHLRG
eukprot:4573245-Pleurochrysis_carterae.AAC.1